MKTPSLKLQRIAAVLAIITAPISALAGPAVAGWIPGTEVAGPTPGSLLQPGPYYARDVYKVYFPPSGGTVQRLIVTGSAGQTVDYFDDIESTGTTGLYCVFGAVDPGTLKLTLQRNGVNVVPSMNLTINPRRTLAQDSTVPIIMWYNVYDASWKPTASNLAAKLDQDFPIMKNQGISVVHFNNRAVNFTNGVSTILSKAAQYGLKARISVASPTPGTTAFTETTSVYGIIHNGPAIPSNNNVPLLAMENALIAKGLNTMATHSAFWGSFTYDEPSSAAINRKVELALMMTKALDPNHSGSFSIGRYVDAGFGASIVAATRFSDFIGGECYALGELPNGLNTQRSDFSNVQAQSQGGYPSVPVYFSNLRSYDTRRSVEMIVQAFRQSGRWRMPWPNEIRAMTFIGAARGARLFTYFTLRDGFNSVGFGLLNGSNSATNTNWAEVGSINAKLVQWMPTYVNLVPLPTGVFNPITYAVNGGVAGGFYYKTNGTRYIIVVNTDTVFTRGVTVTGLKSENGTIAGSVTKSYPTASTPFSYNVNGTLSVTLPPGVGELFRVND